LGANLQQNAELLIFVQRTIIYLLTNRHKTGSTAIVEINKISC